MLRQFLRRFVPGRSNRKIKPKDRARSLLSGHSHVLLHVGKTGGTSLRVAMRKLQREGKALQLVKLPHSIGLPAVNRVAPQMKIGFVYRDPLDRFVSGFDCRIRNGRPEYNVMWRPEEAAAFSFFTSANELAEALSSPDHRLKSAALFSMNAISHLRRGYEYAFGSLETLESVKDRLYFICDLKDLDERAAECFAPFGISKADVSASIVQRNKGTSKKNPLSDLAKENLRSFWHKEFQFYEAFKALDRASRSSG